MPAYRAVLILGPNIPFTDEMRQLYKRDDCLVIGDGKRVLTADEVHSKLLGKVDSGTRFDIHTHGDIHPQTKQHHVGLFPQLYPTSDILSLIKLACPEPIQCHLWSCYGGAAAQDVMRLSPGSCLIAHAPDNSPSSLAGNNDGILYSVKSFLQSKDAVRGKLNYQEVVDNIAYGAGQNLFFSMNSGGMSPLIVKDRIIKRWSEHSEHDLPSEDSVKVALQYQYHRLYKKIKSAIPKHGIKGVLPVTAPEKKNVSVQEVFTYSMGILAYKIQQDSISLITKDASSLHKAVYARLFTRGGVTNGTSDSIDFLIDTLGADIHTPISGLAPSSALYQKPFSEVIMAQYSERDISDLAHFIHKCGDTRVIESLYKKDNMQLFSKLAKYCKAHDPKALTKIEAYNTKYYMNHIGDSNSISALMALESTNQGRFKALVNTYHKKLQSNHVVDLLCTLQDDAESFSHLLTACAPSLNVRDITTLLNHSKHHPMNKMKVFDRCVKNLDSKSISKIIKNLSQNSDNSLCLEVIENYHHILSNKHVIDTISRCENLTICSKILEKRSGKLKIEEARTLLMLSKENLEKKSLITTALTGKRLVKKKYRAQRNSTPKHPLHMLNINKSVSGNNRRTQCSKRNRASKGDDLLEKNEMPSAQKKSRNKSQPRSPTKRIFAQRETQRQQRHHLSPIRIR